MDLNMNEIRVIKAVRKCYLDVHSKLKKEGKEFAHWDTADYIVELIEGFRQAFCEEGAYDKQDNKKTK